MKVIPTFAIGCGEDITQLDEGYGATSCSYGKRRAENGRGTYRIV